MAARRSSPEDPSGLQHGPFQTPTERARLAAAVHQVFGGQPWGSCCSDVLSEVLPEAGQRCSLKLQLFWDFQLLDSDHDGYLSAREAELLLAQVPGAQATGEAGQRFLQSRRPGVAWRDIEDWLSRGPPLPPDGAGTHSRRSYYSGQGAGSQVSTPLPLWGARRQTEPLLERWDPGGFATPLGEQFSGTVAALERKYRVLRRRLCAEMLQAHYGQAAWDSLSPNEKEDKLSELAMLVDFSLREGSLLSLNSLPGALHPLRSGTQTFEGDPAVAPHDCLATEEGTAAHALQLLQGKRQAEVASLMTQRRLLVGSNLEMSRRLLHLHAQAELIQKEASFSAALLVLELLTGERFWDSQPATPEACHQELAGLRLTTGRRPKAAWRETETAPGRSMTQVLLDRLLLQQERDRSTLVHLLWTLTDPEITRERGHDETPLSPLGAGVQGDEVSPGLQGIVSQMLAQKRLEAVARRVDVSWQDCAVAVLMDLQQEQQQELSQAIEDLVGIASGREGEASPTLYESLLARLQEPPLMPLIRRRQPWPSTSWQMGREKEAVPADEMEKAVDGGGQPSLKEKQERLVTPAQGPPQAFDLPDGVEEKTLPTQETLAPLPQEREEPEATPRQLEREALQAHQDLQEKRPALQISDMGPSEAPYNQQQKVPGLSPFQGILLKKSKSLDPQELSQVRVEEPWGSPQVQLGCVHPQGPQPQGPRKAEIQEGSQAEGPSSKDRVQNWEFPERGQELVQSPAPLQKEPGVSVVEEGPDLKAPGASSRERPVPCSQAQGKTEAGLALRETTEAQENLKRSLEIREQVGALRKPEALPPQAGLARKAKSLESEATSRTQGGREQENLLTPEMPQGIPLEGTQKGLDLPQGMLWEVPDALTAPQTREGLRASGREQEGPESQGKEQLHRHAQGPMGPEGVLPHIPGPLQGDRRGRVVQETGSPQGPYLPEERVLETARDQREPELSRPQDLPLHGNLWRKSKSLELRRAPGTEPQESRGLHGASPQVQDLQNMDTRTLTLRGHKQAEGSGSSEIRSHRPEETCLKKEEALQVIRMKQEEGRSDALQNVEEMGALLPKDGQEAESQRSQEVPLEKTPSRDLMESPERHPHERKGLEISYVQEAAPETQAGISQELRRRETPPLLWRVLWQKAKSFELSKRDVLRRPELELALAQEITQGELGAAQFPQEMKETSLVQPQDKPEMGPETQTPQEPRHSEILSNQRKVEAEKATQGEKPHQILKMSGIPLDARVEPSNISGEIWALSPQETRKPEAPAIQEGPQGSPEMLQSQGFPQKEVKLASHLGTSVQGEPKEPQLSERKTLENRQAQDTISQKDVWVHQPEEGRNPESPPLLWAASGIKSKSFELAKADASEARDLGRSQRVQSQKKVQMNLKLKEPYGSKHPSVISSRELREDDATQVQAEKESLKEEKIGFVDSQGAVPQKETPQPQESETLKHPLLQEKRGFLDEKKMEFRRPHDQGIPQINLSETPQKGAGRLKEPEVVFQELGVPQALQPYEKECHEILEPQEDGSPPKTVLHHQEGRSSETPPLLWGVLELKAKSFELQKPKVFQTQDMRRMEPAFLAQRVSQEGPRASQVHGVHGLQRVLLQGEPPLATRAPETQADGPPGPLGPAEQRELLVQTEEKSSHTLKASDSQEESTPPMPQIQHRLLQDSNVVPVLQHQKLGRLETHQAQASSPRRPATSQSTIIQQQGFEQASRQRGEETPGSPPWPPSAEMETGLPQHPKRTSPETPPLFWWALELAQRGRLHRGGLAPSHPQEEPPATARQVGLERQPKATEAGSFVVSSQGVEKARVRNGVSREEGATSMGELLSPQEKTDSKSPQLQEERSLKGESVSCGWSVSQLCESRALEGMEAKEPPKAKDEVLEAQGRRKRQPAPLQKSTQIERDPQDAEGSQRDLEDLKSSLLQGKGSPIWDSKERDPFHDQGSAPSQEKPDSPHSSSTSLQTQEMLKGEPGGGGPSGGPQVLGQKETPLESAENLEGVKLGDCTAAETPEDQRKAEGLLPPGKLIRKSKSLDLTKLRDPDSQDVWQQEAPQAHGEKTSSEAFQVPEELQMKPPKLHMPEASEAQSTGNVPRGRDAESQTSPQGILGGISEPLQLMEPEVPQSQELKGHVALHPRGSPQSHPENLTLQGRTDPKALCPQGHCEGGGSCNSVGKDKPGEMHGVLQRSASTFLLQEAAESQKAQLRKSKSLEPQERSAVLLQGLKETATLQASESAKEYPQVLESCGNDPPHCDATEMENMALQDLQVLRNEVQSPTQQEKSPLEDSAPQKRENGPDLLGAREDVPLKMETFQGVEEMEVPQPPRAPQVKDAPVQIPGVMEANAGSSVSLEPKDSKNERTLRLQETPMKEATSLESPTEWPITGSEAKAFGSWRTLGKSKSLDSGEFRALQSKPLGRNEDSPELQNINKLGMPSPQRKLQEQLRAPQETLPLHEHLQEDSQNQDERGSEVQRKHQVESEPVKVQEPMRNEGPAVCFQNHEDTEMFSFKKCEELEDRSFQEHSPREGECLAMERGKQVEQDPQGLEENQLLDSQEKGDVQSPALLRNLIRKSKTLGFEFPRRSDVGQIQDVPKSESPRGQVTLKLGTRLPHEQREQGAHRLEQLSQLDVLRPQKMLNMVGGTLGLLEHLDPQRLAHEMEDEAVATQISPCDSEDFLQEQNGEPRAALRAVLPHDIPQLGIKLLQELGELPDEPEALRPQGLKDEGALHPQETRDAPDTEEHRTMEPGRASGLQIPPDQEWRGVEAHHPRPVHQKVSEVRREELEKQLLLQSPQKAQGPFQTPGVVTEAPDGSARFPILEGSRRVQPLEGLPEASPRVPEAMGPPHLQSQEGLLLKDLQKSPQFGWEPLKAEGEMIGGEPGTPVSPEELQKAWLTNSRSREAKERSRTARAVQHQDRTGPAEGLHTWERSLDSPQMATCQRPLERHPQGLGSQETAKKMRTPGIHSPQNLTEREAHPVDEAFTREQEASRLEERRPIRLYRREWELQMEMEALGADPQTESPACEEWSEAGTWSEEGAPQKTLLTPGVSPLDLGHPEPGATSRRLQTSQPWEEEATETWKPTTAVPMLSPPSPGRDVEEPRWEMAAFRTGLSREASICVAQGGRPSRLPQEDMQADGEGTTGPIVLEEEEEEEARPWQPPPPRPPCREKAFIWCSRQEKEEALRRLAEIQAEGGRRHQRDKERQSLRFQERLSIAKHRRMQDDLLGGSPSERWLLSAARPGPRRTEKGREASPGAGEARKDLRHAVQEREFHPERCDPAGLLSICKVISHPCPGIRNYSSEIGNVCF
uniref:Uncharacterized protein isoform X2 n=1 Tax=Pogona vitticeps TaxID=103695 RepID=A0ABM5GLH1_9SAUR